MSLIAECEAMVGQGAVWREIPDSFDEFVTSPAHLGPLYPRQRAAVIELIGDDPAAHLRGPADRVRRGAGARAYQQAVLLWGKGAGKDYLCSILVCYLVYVLLCLRDPQAFLELAPREYIDVINVAYNADQAKRVFFAKLKARIEGWAWLPRNFTRSRAAAARTSTSLGVRKS